MLLDASKLKLMNTENPEALQKSITKAQAKSVHKDLPPGGVWRTIRGNHVYIVNGQIVAGAGVGKTGKPVKLTKKQLAEHFSELQKEKGAGKDAGKASKKVGTKRKQAAKPAAKKDTKKASEVKTAKKSKPEVKGSKLQTIARTSTDGMDMWMNASEDPDAVKELKERMATMEGSTKEKLDKLFKELGGGTETPEYVPDSTKKMDDFTKGKAKFKPSEVTLQRRKDGRTTLASAPSGATIEIHDDFVKQPEEAQRYIVAHEVGHIISNAFPNLERHILDNPEGALGRVNQKKGRFEGLAHTPEESWAEAYAYYHTDPEYLKKNAPKAYEFVEKVLKKIPEHKKYLDKAYEALGKLNGKTAVKKDTKKGRAGVKDIRTEAQKNRELAYDVGDKVGGARKDTYQRNFYAHPTPETLAELERIAPELAQVACKKEHILKKVDFEAEYKKGTDVNVAFLKQLIYDRISPKPSEDTPEARMAYLKGIHELHRILTPIKSWDEMKNAIRDLGTLAWDGKRLAEAKNKLANQQAFTYLNTDLYNEYVRKGEAAKKQLDFGALGEKLENFFTDYKARDRTITTLAKKGLSWDTYFTPSEQPEKPKVERGAQKKRWERRAVDEHQRVGGRETPVKKPEDMVKHFGMKGVEFGHWVDDSAGLYHLKRSAEAFHDLADILGIDDKDISLNGRLSMAFGARGKGGALAHYEPDRKVINMTKYGGAGSLAHEWGHALDNILYMYSHGGKGSIFMGSEGGLGDHDPKLKALYSHLMDAITKPAPGEKGGVKKITLDSSAKMQTTYYPQMRRDAESGMSAQELYTKWHKEINDRYDREVRVVASSSLRTEADKAKKIASIERKRKADINDLAHHVASEMRYAKFGRGSAEHFKEEIEVPTGKSEYLTRMEEMDGGGKPYYAEPAEMFARVFESYIEDKLGEKKRKNNYLVWDTKTKRGTDAPFPVDGERKYMHNAMESLLYYIAKEGALKKALEFDLLKAWNESDHPRDEQGRFTEGGKGQDFDKTVAQIRAHNERLKQFAKRFGSAEEFAQAVDKPGFGGKPIWEIFGMIDANSHNHLDADAIKTTLAEGGNYYYLTHVDPKVLYVQDEGHLSGIHATPFDQSKAKPIVVGNNNFIVDGRHRTVNAKQSGASEILAYVPAKAFYNLHVNGNPFMKGFMPEPDKKYLSPLEKAIIPDPTGTSPFPEDGTLMFRGVGQRELDFIRKNGYIMSKGKGNDEDKEDRETCFSNLFRQAEGYARSNYDLYGEEAAYVLVLPKPPTVEEDEHGELIARGKIPAVPMAVTYIPKETDGLQKSLTPEGVHSDLPPGGRWITYRRHHIYIKDGKVIAGSEPHLWIRGKYSKLESKELSKHQERLDRKEPAYMRGASEEESEGKATKTTKASTPAAPKKTTYTVAGHSGKEFERASHREYTHAVVGVKRDGSKSAISFHSAPHLASSKVPEYMKNLGKDFKKFEVHPVVPKDASVKAKPKKTAKKLSDAEKVRKEIDAMPKNPKPKATKVDPEYMAKQRAEIDAMPKNPKPKVGKGATKKDLDNKVLADNKKAAKAKSKPKAATKDDLDALFGLSSKPKAPKDPYEDAWKKPLNDFRQERIEATGFRSEHDLSERHRMRVIEALREGKPVPDSVLSDYPMIKEIAADYDFFRQYDNAEQTQAAKDLYSTITDNGVRYTKKGWIDRLGGTARVKRKGTRYALEFEDKDPLGRAVTIDVNVSKYEAAYAKHLSSKLGG